MTPEEFLKDLATQIGPAFKQTHENLLTIGANFQALFDRMDRDHKQIKANFDAVHRDMLVTQGNIEALAISIDRDHEATHREIQALLEVSRSAERRLGLLEKEAPTGPIRRPGAGGR